MMTGGAVETLVILIPTSAVGLIIGKAGLFLKYIGHISGAQLRLQSFDEMTHGIQERAIFITGEPTSIKSAVQVIMLRLQVPSEPGRTFSGGVMNDRNGNSDGSMEAGGYSGGSSSSDQHVIQWIIPQSSCGLLIGKNGSRIKMINEQSGAWVKIAHPEETGPDVGECYIYIRGTVAQTADALTMVKRIAGGRPSKVKETDMDSHTLGIPLRSVSDVLYLDHANGSSIQDLFASEEISFKVETQYMTGFSSAKVVLKGGTKERQKEVETFVMGRLSVWESNNVFNEQHLLNTNLQDRDEDDSGSMRDEVGSYDIRARAEMCLLMVYPTESALLVEGGEGGTSLFADIISMYGVSLSLLPENALSSSFGSRSRVVALVGALGSLLHSLGPVQAVFKSNLSPQSVMMQPPPSSGHYRDAEPSRSGSIDKMSASLMSMNMGGSMGGMELRGAGGSMGGGAGGSSRHRGVKRIDQLTSTIQELVAAMKQTDMVTDPPFMKFLLAFDEFKTAYQARAGAGGMSMSGQQQHQQHQHYTSPLASGNSSMREAHRPTSPHGHAPLSAYPQQQHHQQQAPAPATSSGYPNPYSNAGYQTQSTSSAYNPSPTYPISYP